MFNLFKNKKAPETAKSKVGTESYKGVRDFYPKDMAIQNYIFNIWRKTAESFGYVEYEASILESAELYKAKSGEEIVKEQMYVFKDRGDREVALRPEMTPTLARMIASKRKGMIFPIRWYSIPNLFRYEKPQRGRMREFFQFNADIFGVSGMEADIEIISLAYETMKNFGFNDAQFVIKIFIGTNATKSEAEILIKKLAEIGIKNTEYDESIARGMQYYTGIVFEMYDTGKENPRAIFGGGRYDNLLDIFGAEKVPAVGFGMGDVIIKNLLETYGLLPQIAPSAQLYICVMDKKNNDFVQKMAQKARASGIKVAVDYSGKKIGDQIKYADKNKIPFVVVIGEEEVKTGKLKVKELASGKETETTVEELKKIIKF